jgi:uncharacterized protein (DUF983 family)
MYTNFPEHDSMNDCPKCGKRSLAKVSDQRYQCIWCRFYRDLSNDRGPGDGGSFLFLLFIGALLLVVLL